MDTLEPDRGGLFESLPALMETAQETARRRESGQISLFGETIAPFPAGGPDRKPSPSTWSRRERLVHEREALGFYITGHPLNDYAAEMELFANATSSRIPALMSGTEVRIGGIIGSMRQKTTKQGKKMAYLQFEDLEGVLEVVVFPETFQQSQDALSCDGPVFLVGRVERGEKTAKLLATEIFRMENIRERLARSVHLQIITDRMTPADIVDLRKMLERNSGEKKGFLHLVREGEYETILSLPESLSVAPSITLARELRMRFGYDVLRLH